MDPDRKKYSLEYYLKIAEQLVDHGLHTLAIKVCFHVCVCGGRGGGPQGNPGSTD